MILISHRGNTNGKNIDKENTYEYIIKTLKKGYNVEVDIWFIENKWFLGHDKPLNDIKLYDFHEYINNIWFHCKNVEALNEMQKYNNNIIYFWHQNDNYTLTSNKLIWTYPGEKLTNKSICVLPELHKYNKKDLVNCYGICSDNIKEYKNIIYNKK